MTDLTRPFQLHMPDQRILHGAQFPSGRVMIDGQEGENEISPLYAISLGVALEKFPGGLVLWPEDLAARSAD